MITKALCDGKLIDIEDVKDTEEGVIYTCPMCGARVIAKKGEDRAHHFAHYRVEDCGATDDMVFNKFNSDLTKSKKMNLM